MHRQSNIHKWSTQPLATVPWHPAKHGHEEMKERKLFCSAQHQRQTKKSTLTWHLFLYSFPPPGPKCWYWCIYYYMFALCMRRSCSQLHYIITLCSFSTPILDGHGWESSSERFVWKALAKLLLQNIQSIFNTAGLAVVHYQVMFMYIMLNSDDICALGARWVSVVSYCHPEAENCCVCMKRTVYICKPKWKPLKPPVIFACIMHLKQDLFVWSYV